MGQRAVRMIKPQRRTPNFYRKLARRIAFSAMVVCSAGDRTKILSTDLPLCSGDPIASTNHSIIIST